MLNKRSTRAQVLKLSSKLARPKVNQRFSLDCLLGQSKRSQQEMVGFVLIVVLVVVAIMIFLIISARKSNDIFESKNVENMLSSIMSYTTECAIITEPDYDSTEELIKSCYDNDRCTNLDKAACDYLEELMSKVLEDIIKSEGNSCGYKFETYLEEGENILDISNGNFSGNILSASRIISWSGGKIFIKLGICYE